MTPKTLHFLLITCWLISRTPTTEATERTPLLDFSYGEIHFRKIGGYGLRAFLGNPFATLKPPSNQHYSNDSFTKQAVRHPDVVRSIAIIWKPNVPLFVSLDVYVTIVNHLTGMSSTSKISLQVESDELTYAVENKLLLAFNVICANSTPISDYFYHRYKLPHSTKAIILGLFNWTSFPKNRLFYPPAIITHHGRSFTSFPLADGVVRKCRAYYGNNNEDDALMKNLAVEISGEFELNSKVGAATRVYAHADNTVDVSSYYAQSRIEHRCSDKYCLPVYIDARTVSTVAPVGDDTFAEFSCRPSAQRDDILEWWRCTDLGRQSTTTTSVVRGIPKYNVTVALGDYLVYCSESRFRDARALKWRWYNETSKMFDEFPLKGWRGSDTSCLWFSASMEEAITRRAYQCIETATSKPVKEIFFEYNNHVVHTETCKFFTNGIFGAASGDMSAGRQQRQSILSISPNVVSRATITCQLGAKLDSCAPASPPPVNENDTAIIRPCTRMYSVVRWDKIEAVSVHPDFQLQARYMEDTDVFHLHITADMQEANIKRYLGVYTLVLHFEHDVSQLVMQFRLKRATAISADDRDGLEGLSAPSSLYPQHNYRTLLTSSVMFTQLICLRFIICNVAY